MIDVLPLVNKEWTGEGEDTLEQSGILLIAG
jgi:hypothetical protein